MEVSVETPPVTHEVSKGTHYKDYHEQGEDSHLGDSQTGAALIAAVIIALAFQPRLKALDFEAGRCVPAVG